MANGGQFNKNKINKNNIIKLADLNFSQPRKAMKIKRNKKINSN